MKHFINCKYVHIVPTYTYECTTIQCVVWYIQVFNNNNVVNQVRMSNTLKLNLKTNIKHIFKNWLHDDL